MSNDFENIQMIYEGFRGQHASLRSYGPNMKWAPGDAPPNQTLSNIPGHLPLASPGSARYEKTHRLFIHFAHGFRDTGPVHRLRGVPEHG